MTEQAVVDEATGVLLDAVAPPADPVMMSRAIGQLAAALAKAQGAMKSPEFDRENPHFRSRFLSLAGLWQAARGPLAANGLALAQCASADGLLIRVDTLLLHESGEFLRTSLACQARDIGPQALGSAVTYARRYAFSAVVGLVGDLEDDDGEASEGRATPAATPAKGRASRAAPAVAAPAIITEAQMKRLWSIASSRGWRKEELKAWLLDAHNLDSIKTIPAGLYDTIIESIEAGPPVADEAPF